MKEGRKANVLNKGIVLHSMLKELPVKQTNLLNFPEEHQPTETTKANGRSRLESRDYGEEDEFERIMGKSNPQSNIVDNYEDFF